MFASDFEYDEKTMRKKWKEDSAEILTELKGRLEGVEDFSEANTEATFKGMLEEKGLGFGKVGPIFRLALTGLGMGPSLFEISAILGREEVLNRIDRLIATAA
jgi:glutamyl-tRNA synthetase